MKLTNADFERIMREYDSKQYQSNLLQIERKNTLYSTLPELKEIENCLVTLSASLAKKSAFLSFEEFEMEAAKLAEEKQTLLLKKQHLIAESGYPSDYLTDVYECKDCKDTGMIKGVKCHCFEEKANKLLKNREMLSKLPENAKFCHFKDTYYRTDDYNAETGKSSRENALSAYQLALNFVEKFPNSPDNLVIYGNTGTGKTFLAGCIANALSDQSYSVSFVTAFQFFSILEKYAFHKTAPDHFKIEDSVNYLLDCDLLVLDDIGTEIVNSFTLTKLYEFINERILNGKSTILTTNFDPQAISKVYGERILSRLAGNYSFAKLTGADIRLLKGAKDLDETP